MKCPACGTFNIDGSDECDSCRASLTLPDEPKKGMERRILEGTVAQIAPRQALTIAAGQKASDALESMRKNQVGCLLVVEGGRLTGVVSESSILDKLKDPLKLAGASVADVMRSDGTCLREEDGVADAFHQMAVSGHRHLAVRLSDGRLAVVSSRDLLRYLCE